MLEIRQRLSEAQKNEAARRTQDSLSARDTCAVLGQTGFIHPHHSLYQIRSPSLRPGLKETPLHQPHSPVFLRACNSEHSSSRKPEESLFQFSFSFYNSPLKSLSCFENLDDEPRYIPKKTRTFSPSPTKRKIPGDWTPPKSQLSAERFTPGTPSSVKRALQDPNLYKPTINMDRLTQEDFDTIQSTYAPEESGTKHSGGPSSERSPKTVKLHAERRTPCPPGTRVPCPVKRGLPTLNTLP